MLGKAVSVLPLIMPEVTGMFSTTVDVARSKIPRLPLPAWIGLLKVMTSSGLTETLAAPLAGDKEEIPNAGGMLPVTTTSRNRFADGLASVKKRTAIVELVLGMTTESLM